MNRALAGTALLAVVFSGLSCGGGGDSTGPTPADPGPVTLVLSTPNTDDGALIVSVTGGTVTSVQASGYEFSASTGGTTTRILVRGSIMGGPVVQLTLPDRHKLTSYRLTVDQVAARAPTYRQRTVVGYGVSLSNP